MIEYELSADDLADTRFAISPVQELVFSLWALRDPGRYTLHLPWRRAALAAVGADDLRLLLALVGAARGLPDFLTPRPDSFTPSLAEELATVRRTPPDIVDRDLAATHRPGPVPAVLRTATLADLIAVLERYWAASMEAVWPRMRLVLEADTTYRARRLAIGGARALFEDLHPNVTWDQGTVRIDKMIGRHRVLAAGRGLLLLPSVFAYKPIPPMSPDEPPWLSYPARGVADLWQPPAPVHPGILPALVGPPKARLLALLGEESTTTDLARRLGVTPGAVSQHLRVLHASGLLIRTRAGRSVLYRRSPLGDRLTGMG
ncbi:ArsR/SmtB family transcription factor [Actinoplanes utahensis]|uniref:MarR family transcriptional regulator n=1 Tax=Actinoplanes utahensis TaxID=1869 RepID=A0A0A6UKL6_ACTUT|nr:ArsR family transcriptional regulator [Actinoplanes utahensis]KHD74834.1 MarR family transcriptional regulator [Actinoplanes utahensis]GIF30806.1 transcriptional regulator [Actinoplanes utahensis]